jgi:asparagine synthase (glutamine-hydrolysing)
MCGIVGIVSNDSRRISEEKLSASIGVLQHRGPDGQGYWTNEKNTVAFGHRRLSIIDLSTAASQPMHYPDRYTIVYNGEIYNYLELKEELNKKGFYFRTGSDTEVVVAAFAAYGKECLQHLDGMFAFAIWDDEKQQLFAARDRFGEKPFFFSYFNNTVVFASEMKALWELGVPKEVNGSMLYNFLTIGYTSNPSEPQETFYHHVRKLPASCFLSYSLASQELVIERYWHVDININNTIKEEEAIEEFTRLLSASVSRRLRSDVPVGTSLSGGLDSSTIVALCDRNAPAQYTHKCFTASFTGYENDETHYAKQIADKYHLDHHLVTISEEEIPSSMERIMSSQEEPFSSASVIAQYKVYEAARQNGVTVLLDGQGADEILAGYHKYYKWYWQELYRSKQLKSSGEIKAARALGIKESFGIQNKVAALMPDFSTGILQGQKAKQAFKHPDLNHDFALKNKRNLYYSTPATFDLNGALYYNSFVNGLDELLRLADRNSMAHGTEVRLPFLDHILVEFLFTLPPSFKIHQGWTKWLLRKSMDNILPAEIVWRKDKVGFEPPQKLWMQNADVQNEIRGARKKLYYAGVLSESILAKKIEAKSAHEAKSYDWRYWSAAKLF